MKNAKALMITLFLTVAATAQADDSACKLESFKKFIGGEEKLMLASTEWVDKNKAYNRLNKVMVETVKEMKDPQAKQIVAMVFLSKASAISNDHPEANCLDAAMKDANIHRKYFDGLSVLTDKQANMVAFESKDRKHITIVEGTRFLYYSPTSGVLAERKFADIANQNFERVLLSAEEKKLVMPRIRQIENAWNKRSADQTPAKPTANSKRQSQATGSQ